ncbi:hypothetical protein [Haloarchaeobius litoreus]|uniref:Type I restriction enzyme, R subunit n=1 Tax=Haloarchaeobius litoreus TaxID=755306 RepID=A0ABD6DJW4_9EURY|nr:hypothetical protein [Haloarchaeobius litoreus]
MDDEILDEQRELVRVLEAHGWDVTESELSVYESPWEDDDTPEATITLTARRQFPGSEVPEGVGEDGGDDDNPYRLK